MNANMHLGNKDNYCVLKIYYFLIGLNYAQWHRIKDVVTGN